MIDAGDERLRTAEGPGFSDSVTVAFGDPAAGVYAVARLGIVPGADPKVSALAVLCADARPVAAVAQGQLSVPRADWPALDAAGVRMETVEPLRAWRAAFTGDQAGFDVGLSALTAPIEIAGGGLQGYDQLCRVEGTAVLGGEERAIDALGQRTHAWGAADWDRMESVRTVAAWLGEDRAVGLQAVRPPGAAGHEGDAVSAWLVEDDGPIQLAEARLSTTYDDEGRQRHAGLELWEREDSEYPHRVAGEVVCGSTLDLGALRLDTAFFRFRMEGREGAGRYDVLRRA
ncbi:MAG TPA: hypothetical protein VHR88_10320 [Solirubrobacteraceae bacterium]|nr:hypothetical protein [Solirubrobacteraceae bacterium]